MGERRGGSQYFVYELSLYIKEARWGNENHTPSKHLAKTSEDGYQRWLYYWVLLT